MKTSTLFFLGVAAFALWSTIQTLLHRTAHSTDFTDFLLGIVFGVGAGLLMIVAWRSGRKLRH